jgi:hypothetical protein
LEVAERRAMNFVLRPEYAAALRWSRRGSCGNPGCSDPECCCSLCGRPIGIPEDDPRFETHDEYCPGCELCVDQLPLMLFRGKGRETEQAQFHKACFEKLARIRHSAADG